jgi:hypothetical protein
MNELVIIFKIFILFTFSDYKYYKHPAYANAELPSTIIFSVHVN